MQITPFFNIPQLNIAQKPVLRATSLAPLERDTVSFSSSNVNHTISFDDQQHIKETDEFKRYNIYDDERAKTENSAERVLYGLLTKYKDITLDTSGIFGDYENNWYDLPEKFTIAANNTLQKDGRLMITAKMPKMFKGIDQKELSEKLDLLPMLLEKRKINLFEMGGKKFKAVCVSLNSGSEFGDVYKITDSNGDKVAFKAFRDPDTVNTQGVYGEISIALEMQKENISDVPEFYLSNPTGKRVINTLTKKKKTTGAWQITEFVTKDTPKKEGKRLNEWLKEKHLIYTDVRDQNKIGSYTVDLGGITNLKFGYSSEEEMNGLEYLYLLKALTRGYQDGKDPQYFINTLDDMYGFSAQP